MCYHYFDAYSYIQHDISLITCHTITCQKLIIWIFENFTPTTKYVMEYHSIHDPTILLRSLHTYCRYMWPICWGTAPAIPSLQQNLSMCHFWPLFAPVTVTTRFSSILVRLTYKFDFYVPLDVLDCKKPLHFNTDHISCIYFIFRQTFEFVKSDRSVTTITHMWIVVRKLQKVNTSKP